MDRFYQIITELWPLIEVQNCVLLNIIFRGRVSCLSALLLLAIEIKTKKLLIEEQSDQCLHCLLFHLHHLKDSHNGRTS